MAHVAALVAHVATLVACVTTLVAHVGTLVAQGEALVAQGEALVAQGEALVAQVGALVAQVEALVTQSGFGNIPTLCVKALQGQLGTANSKPETIQNCMGRAQDDRKTSCDVSGTQPKCSRMS